jgi:hypothetical protein
MVMSRISRRRSLLIALFTCLVIPAGVGRADMASPIIGTWKGTSECVQSDSPCRDEVNVYRFTKISGKPNAFLGIGSKVVNGQEIEMGTLEWTFIPEYHALETEVSGSTLHLVLMGNKMEGTLKTPNKIIYRRIHLQRAD